jgi:hypothetical protein
VTRFGGDCLPIVAIHVRNTAVSWHLFKWLITSANESVLSHRLGYGEDLDLKDQFSLIKSSSPSRFSYNPFAFAQRFTAIAIDYSLVAMWDIQFNRIVTNWLGPKPAV